MKEKYRVEVHNVSKIFNLGNKTKSGLSRVLDFIFGIREVKKISALENISFKVKPGKNLGIIGRNGSGKSTLLRIIAGIYRIDKGNVRTNGKLVYLTGFGKGLKEKLTVRENIFLMGSILGLSQFNIRKKFKEIIKFAELEDYIDVRVDKLSSGMKSRLGFSITIFCINYQNPDILLIDEAIGAGVDINFQEKVVFKMKEFIKGGATVILVSHNLNYIRSYCDEVILLEKGKIIKKGVPKKVISFYTDRNRKKRLEKKEKRIEFSKRYLNDK